MKIKVYPKEEYGNLNAYEVTGKNRTQIYRTGCPHEARFNGRPVPDNNYIVIGRIGGKIVGIRCVDYASARALFNAMETQ